MRALFLCAAVGAVLPMAAAAQIPDPATIEAGRAAFAPCRPCHSVGKGDNRLGPSLHGIVGRKVASLAGYDFSPAMKACGGTWTRGRLDAYLAAPRQVVPNSKMSFAGIRDPARRAALIEYLATLR
ncbi:MAG: c-type cytochrome [Sphingomonadaceae bacterium]|uniref:c-type cytochrome n=1 Tax=Thermaurantiacus sp. TaxID=2820283 RepID=UPI00298F0341|nr:c-type cytochrome [Thermaurantiacus sp.]MCS6986250.1 c-type cytochrome [Sphingomonadaceae bacterium]MDW8415697.1 c-type cytochrome [Thermaurantiacus sp.]